jgi:hypothetical protein
LRRKLVQWYFIHEHQQRFSRCLNGGAAVWSAPNADLQNTRAIDSSITSANVSKLRVAWRIPLKHAGGFGYYANTRVVGQDGTIYFQDLGYNVFAADGKCRPRAS